ncbi:sensor histidine kinase [Paraburkholderia youngii]|uniref:sensor histidine kinase n=1 Tax=Paraburkholderia youngii TaxID=2782701 RepID=UPI003D2462C9
MRFEEQRSSQVDLFNHQLFLSAPIPIMVEDWSRVYTAIMDLRRNGIANLDAWLDSHPQVVAEFRSLQSFVEANDAVVELFEAGTRTAFFERARQLLPADRTSNTAVYRAMLEGRDACQGERTLVTFSGKRVPIVWRCSLPKHEDGYRRLCFFGFDVTAQKENNNRMQAMRAQTARSARVSLFGEVAVSILHDISQPLSATRTSADAAVRWLRNDIPNIGRAIESIQDAARWARDATEICKKIGRFIGKVPFSAVLSPANEAIDAALLLISPEAISKAVVIDRRVERELSVFADPLQIQQVLANLLLNAIDAIDVAERDERRLTVFVSRAGVDEAMFEVRDSGAGMTEETLSSIFQPFFSTKASGMGLGLVVARSIVEAHGGRIWAESSPGLGTSFFFTLPTSGMPGTTR